MANLHAPRLHHDRAPVLFWVAACVIAFALAFALAFGMGSLWAERRAEQAGVSLAATYNR